VREHEAAVLGDPGQRGHPVDDLAAVAPRRLARGDEEREHADHRGAELAGRVGDAPHPFQLWPQRRADRDLADR